MKVLPETKPVAVAVFDVKVAAAVFLVADVACDFDAVLLEFVVQGVGVLYPDIGVPEFALGVRWWSLGASSRPPAA
jgi:hypothetical protein